MDFCGDRGIWPPYLRGCDGSVKILRQITHGIIKSINYLRQADPKAIIVHVEAASEYIPEENCLNENAEFLKNRARLPTDLILGKVNQDHIMVKWLLEHGMSDEDLIWYQENAIDIDIIGVNYYPDLSVYQVKKFNDSIGTRRIWGGVEGLERALMNFVERYQRPVFITETSTLGSLESRSSWMLDSISATINMRNRGVPLVGYTWWPLYNHIDWVYRESSSPLERFFARLGPPVMDGYQIGEMINNLGWQQLEQLPLEAYISQMGLYALKMQFDGTFSREKTCLVDQYRSLIQQHNLNSMNANQR